MTQLKTPMMNKKKREREIYVLTGHCRLCEGSSHPRFPLSKSSSLGTAAFRSHYSRRPGLALVMKCVFLRTRAFPVLEAGGEGCLKSGPPSAPALTVLNEGHVGVKPGGHLDTCV